jgi:hypothetical protein
MNLAMFACVIKSLEVAKNKLTLEGNKLDRDVLKIQRTLTVELLNSFSDPDNPSDDLNDEEKKLFKENRQANSGFGGGWYYPNKIPVIKRVRERTGLGLAEAKGMTDKYERTLV